MARHENLHVNKLTTDKVVNRAHRINASGAQIIPPGVNFVELHHATQITATIADASDHEGFMVIKQTGTGTAGHTVTLTSGTWNSTNNNTATFNAIEETILVHFDSDGNGTVLVNSGTVAFSTV